MSGIIDLHCHILPAVDDGSASLEESIALLQHEARQGIEHVIATPHFYAQLEQPETFLARRSEAENRLREAMAAHNGLPRLEVGAEIYYYPGISGSEVLSELTMGAGKCVLIEMPQPPWSDRMYRELEEIAVWRGLTPIIAHIDRYIAPLRTYGIPKKLEKLPVLVQANASFFLRRQTQSMALHMLRSERIHLLGSDCHSITRRPPNLEAAIAVIRRHFGEEALARIIEHQFRVTSE